VEILRIDEALVALRYYKTHLRERIKEQVLDTLDTSVVSRRDASIITYLRSQRRKERSR
jgi:hypothetical protein